MTSIVGGVGLAGRLRELRVDRSLTQPVVAKALGVSVPLVSAWEHGKYLPSAEHVEAYARLFAAEPPAAARRLSVPDFEQLSGPDRGRYDELLTELVTLRGGSESTSRALSPPAWSPLQFPAGQAITIVSSERSAEFRDRLPYSDPSDPNYVKSYQYGDLDALLELYGYVRALNPDSRVEIGVPSRLTIDDRTAHLIVLGGIDFNAVTVAVLDDLTTHEKVPVVQSERATDDDEGAFTVRTSAGEKQTFRPKLVQHGNRTLLAEDVALFVRSKNPYNRDRSVTLCNGMYGRGTYAIVRALTDSKIKDRNAAYLYDRFEGKKTKTYSILCRVKVVANEIVVPDWTLDEFRLHEWPEAKE